MTISAKHISAGLREATPVLVVGDSNRAIEFYKTVFGAKERMRLTAPGGTVVHGELTIGHSVIMVSDEFPERDEIGPSREVRSPVRITLYVEDVDAVAERAVAHGASLLIPIADQFYGDRAGRLADPFGHIWILATHQEDVSQDEMQKRMEAL
jgi:PhnB protein